MEFDVVISETCLEEIDEICKYIETELKAKQAANKLREKIKMLIFELKKSPRIYSKIEKTDREERLYRRAVIDNYILIYTIIEKDKTVLISHMYYSGRNYLEGGLL